MGMLMASAIEKMTEAVIIKIGLEYAAYELQKATEQSNKEMRQQQAAHEAAEQQLRENIEAQRRAKEKKAAAWAQFYHRDPRCDNNPIDDATFTKCANDSVKAKTVFEATYEP